MAAQLVASGVVQRVGLCNVTVVLLERARACHERGAGPPIAAVQNEFSLWTRAAETELPLGSTAKSSKKGVLPYCHSRGIVFMPHGFLGGLKARRGERVLGTKAPALAAVAAALGGGVSPETVALAW